MEFTLHIPGLEKLAEAMMLCCMKMNEGVQSVVREPMQPTQVSIQPSAQPAVQQPTQAPIQQPVQPVVQQPTQAPMQPPVQPVVQQPTQAPIQQPVQPVVQQPTQAPIQPPTQPQQYAQPMPPIPTAAPPAYDFQAIARGMNNLMNSKGTDAAQGLLARFGVQGLNQLQPTQYGQIAAELRAMGVQV